MFEGVVLDLVDNAMGVLWGGFGCVLDMDLKGWK